MASINGTGLGSSGTYLTRWWRSLSRRILGRMERCLNPGFETVDPSVPVLSLPPKPPREWSTPFFSLLLLAVALGLGVRYALPAQLRALVEVPSVLHLHGFLILNAAVATSIVLHEAGHLIAAVLMKFKILGVALGPFRVTRANAVWQFRFTPRSLFSGSVSALPRSTRRWRERMLVVVAAGPIATLVTGAAAAALLLSHLTNPVTNTFLGAVTQLSAFIFVLGLVPNGRHARVRNDARLVSVLRHDSQEARQILLYHLLTQLELAGTRPRDYPEELMRELAKTQGRPDLMLFSANKIALWAWDHGQVATAEAWDHRCLQLSDACQASSRNLALANSACVDVLVRNRWKDAQDKFAEVDWETLSPAWLMHRSRAAYYLTQGNVPECLAEVCRAQFAFPNGLPVYTFERWLLTQLHRMALNVRPPELAKRCAA